nr:LysE family transporter [Desulfobulbaceae bacterium]
MINFVTMGFVLGLSAGLTPGPLFALVVSETLRYGLRAGVIAAMAPLLTDLPIVAASIFFLNSYADSDLILGLVSLFGGVFVFYLGFENFCIKNDLHIAEPNSQTTFRKAILVNALSPHPYLFWITVGAPAVISASRQNLMVASVFVGIFYVMLVGAKVFLAIVVSRSKNFIVGKVFVNSMRMIGLCLWALAIVLVRDGFVLLGWLNNV